MDISKIDQFLDKHGSHTFSIERRHSPGVTVGTENRPKLSLSGGYLLGVPVSHITTLYCCGEVCK